MKPGGAPADGKVVINGHRLELGSASGADAPVREVPEAVKPPRSACAWCILEPERSLKLELQPALAAHYIRSLRKEYGHEEPREVAKRIFETLKNVRDEHREVSQGVRPGGRSGAPEGTQSDLRPAADTGASGRVQDGPAREPTVSGLPRARGTGGEGPNQEGNAGGTQGSRLSDETGQGGFFRDDEEVTRANERDQAKLTKDRLQTKLNSPMTREEQLKKLKRRAPSEWKDRPEKQNDLFGG